MAFYVNFNSYASNLPFSFPLDPYTGVDIICIIIQKMYV